MYPLNDSNRIKLTSALIYLQLELREVENEVYKYFEFTIIIIRTGIYYQVEKVVPRDLLSSIASGAAKSWQKKIYLTCLFDLCGIQEMVWKSESIFIGPSINPEI